MSGCSIAGCLFLILITASVASSAQDLTTLANFDGTNGSGPNSALVQATDGNFYGTTRLGGANNFGTVFKVTPEGLLTTLYRFCSEQACSDGVGPVALVQATDGNLYGTTSAGAISGGTVFKITPGGILTTLYRFDGPHGLTPSGALVQAKDGNFYGVTLGGGNNNHSFCFNQGCGTMFKVTLQGALTVLYNFCALDGCTDGSNPGDGLVQADDGNFYGTTRMGGDSDNCPGGCGTVYKITVGGTLTTLYSFSSTDGSEPVGRLVQADDGVLYGVTLQGGPNNAGTVFKITLGGTLTTLYNFCSRLNCADGYYPDAGLLQATDDNFYGSNSGGPKGGGTLFNITPQGVLTTLYQFCSPDTCQHGNTPMADLVQRNDGNFYGTTYAGGMFGNGTIFRLDTNFLATLSVTDIGEGTVSGTDRHIYCGSVCTYQYSNATGVTLSAIPAPGYTFTGWAGCDNVNGSYCSVTMTSAKNVTATFNLANVTLTSLTFKPSYVRGGQLSAGTLMLNAVAPPGGVTVALSSDHPGVAHPPSVVFVPGGKSSVQFAVNTFPVKSNTTVTITASAGNSQVSGTLMVGTTSFPQSLK